MSVRVSTLVWGRSQARGHVLMLMLALADQANDEGYCWPKQATLARRLRLGSDRAVRKAITAAEELGEVTVIHRTHEGRFIGNAYQINLDALRKHDDIWDAPPEPQFRPTNATTGTTVPVPPEPQFRSPPEPQFRTITVSNNHQENHQGGVVLPEWISEEQWGEFIQHRDSLKKRLTPLAAKKIIQELARLKDQGHNPVQVIDQSITNGWAGVFPVRKDSAAPQGGTARAGEAAKNPFSIRPVIDEEVGF